MQHQTDPYDAVPVNSPLRRINCPVISRMAEDLVAGSKPGAATVVTGPHGLCSLRRRTGAGIIKYTPLQLRKPGNSNVAVHYYINSRTHGGMVGDGVASVVYMHNENKLRIGFRGNLHDPAGSDAKEKFSYEAVLDDPQREALNYLLTGKLAAVPGQAPAFAQAAVRGAPPPASGPLDAEGDHIMTDV